MTRVLIATISLVSRSGTEVVSIETAHGLRERGHDVSFYTPLAGATADLLRNDGFEVVTDIALLASPPAVIQCNQTYALLGALGRFPATPAMSICHDATYWWDVPLDLPSIRRHVAVDFACRDRIAQRFPHLSPRIEILHNAVDLARFRPRAPLPAKPRRALILAKGSAYVETVRAACRRHDIEVDAAGPGVEDVVADLAARLPAYDLVFASARAALEAMAVGCAVVVVDQRGLAGLATTEVLASWRDNNFGRRLLIGALSEDAIAAAIDGYDPGDAGKVCEIVRREASIERYLERLEGIHREVIADGLREPTDIAALIDALTKSCGEFMAALEAHMSSDRQRELDEAHLTGYRLAEARLAAAHDGLHARIRELEQLVAQEGRLKLALKLIHAAGRWLPASLKRKLYRLGTRSEPG